MIWWSVGSFIVVLWFLVSCVRAAQLLGRKYHKETITDKIMLLPLMAVAMTIFAGRQAVRMLRSK